jgi:hypothetical protein
MGGQVSYDKSEQAILLDVFRVMLAQVTKDGGNKRAAGLKPPWWVDDSHLGAVFSHLTKYFRGEIADPDSGAHPLVHAAWRLLAIAYQETFDQQDPNLLLPLLSVHEEVPSKPEPEPQPNPPEDVVTVTQPERLSYVVGKGLMGVILTANSDGLVSNPSGCDDCPDCGVDSQLPLF